MPVIAMVAASAAATWREPNPKLISAFQHFAAGVVFAAVAVELLPEIHELESPFAMVIGFVLGVVSMLAAKALFKKAGMIVPLAVDLFVDGLLIAIGLLAGASGGFTLLIGLTLETLALGLSSAPALVARGMGRLRVIAVMALLGLAILAGALAGNLLADLSEAFLAGILGFGVAALLYLVTEELLAEAHEVEEAPIVTATFFAGFLLPLVLAAI